jgi:hypothetical protein
VTFPDGTTINISSFPYVFTNTSLTGRYNVTFYANDTEGNKVSNDDYFESFVPLNFNFTIIDFNTTGIDSSWEFYYRDEVIFSNSSSTGNYSSVLPDALGDLKVKSYTERLQITLRDINVTLDNGKDFGMDKWSTAESGYLVTYGVNNSYTFTNATVVIYYDDLSYNTEGDLDLYKCDSFDFANRNCTGTWSDVTSSSTQDTASDYFEYLTASFSGFSIKEVNSSVAETISSSGGEGGSGGCSTKWVCGDWSGCIGDVQTRSCTKEVPYCFGDDKPAESQSCGGIPSELFDITFNLDDSVIDDVSKLSGVVTFESFGTIPTPVNLTFIIIDSSGNEVYIKIGEITVTTEEVLRWNYINEGLSELPDGKYVAVLETLYDVDVKDEFRVDFEIKKKKEITERVIDWTFDGGKWWLSGIVGFILIGWLIKFLLSKSAGISREKKIKVRKYRPQDFDKKVSGILRKGDVK